jgi:hypothetical protein
VGTNFLESLGDGDYSTAEGTPSKSNQASIDVYKQTINTTQLDASGNPKAWSANKKSTVIDLLTQIETMISQNRAETQQQMQNLSQSENIIKKEIKDLNDSDTVLRNLQAQKIDSGVQNVCNDEYSEHYQRITEFNYRLAIISQNKQNVKSLLLEYDQDMITIQNYISALST